MSGHKLTARKSNRSSASEERANSRPTWGSRIPPSCRQPCIRVGLAMNHYRSDPMTHPAPDDQLAALREEIRRAGRIARAIRLVGYSVAVAYIAGATIFEWLVDAPPLVGTELLLLVFPVGILAALARVLQVCAREPGRD